MLYAFCLTVTCINETRNSTYHIGLSQPGFQWSGQVGLDRSADLENERNLMNLYVEKKAIMLSEIRVWISLCVFFSIFLEDRREGGSLVQSCPEAENIDPGEVNINTDGSLGKISSGLV